MHHRTLRTRALYTSVSVSNSDVTNWVEFTAVLASPVAALGGYVLAGFNEERRDIRTLERERLAREEVQKQSHNDRAQAFKIDVLLALQDALQQFVIAAGQASWADLRELRRTGTTVPYSDEVNKKNHETLIDLRRLKERVIDDALREGINRLIEMSFRRIDQLKVEDISQTAMIQAIVEIEVAFTEKYNEVNDRVGLLIRKELSPKS